MKTKSNSKDTTKNILTTRTPEAKAAQKQCIAQDKARAKNWAEARRLRANPIGIAQEVVSQRTSRSTPRTKGSSAKSSTPFVSCSTTDNKTHANAILSDLQRKRDKLAHELSQIDLAIQVIKETYK